MLKHKTITLLENIPSDKCKTLCKYIQKETGIHIDYSRAFHFSNIYTDGTDEDRQFLQNRIFNDARLLRRIARGDLQTDDLKNKLKNDIYVYKNNITGMNEEIAQFYNVPNYPSPVYISSEYA